MGIKAFDTHANGAKHKDHLPLFHLFKKKVCNQSHRKSPHQSNAIFQKEVVLKAELIWCLDVVQSKYLFRSSDSKSAQFACMFPDSKIAKDFSVVEKNITI